MLIIILIASFSLSSWADSPPGPKLVNLTLKDAIAKSINLASRIKMADLEWSSALAQQANATSRPNPELGLSLQNSLGSGQYKYFSEAQMVYSLSQEFELGNPNRWRKETQNNKYLLSKLNRSQIRLDLIKDTVIAYFEAVAAKEIYQLALEQKKLADDLAREVNARVQKAREPQIQYSKTLIEVFSANFDLSQAERELSFAKHALANIWHAHEEDFLLDHSEFFKVDLPLTENHPEELFKNNPDLKLRELIKHSAEAEFGLENALKFNKIRAEVNVNHYLKSRDYSFNVGLSFPLPFATLNQANIEEKRVGIIKAAIEEQAAHSELLKSVHEWLKNQEIAYKLIKNLEDHILPEAKRSFDLALMGYRAGKLSHLEVLDSERTLGKVKEQYIVALKNYHEAKAYMDRLTAKHLPEEGAQGETEHVQ